MSGGPTIRKLAPIRSLGVFRDWRDSDVPEFLKYNLIYGFNGSGKTTLSRILASLEVGKVRTELPEGGTFEVKLNDGTLVKSTGPLDALEGRILVFNVDFIEESFAWKDGSAKPVFYVGREQASLAEELANTSAKIQSLVEREKSVKQISTTAAKSFAELKRNVARLIAEQLNLGRKYIASNLETDYRDGPYGDQCKITDHEISQARAIILQAQPLEKRVLLSPPEFRISDLISRTIAVTDVTLGSLAVEDLKEHEAMREWVLEGLKYHEDNHLGKCLFCSNAITKDRLGMLRTLVDAKYEKLKAEIESLTQLSQSLEAEYQGWIEGLPSSNDISQSLRSSFKKSSASLKQAIQDARKVIAIAKAILSDKTTSPHIKIDSSSLAALDADAVAKEIQACIDSINALFDRHNAEFDQFDNAKAQASKRLRKHYLAENQAAFSEQEAAANQARKDLDTLDAEIESLRATEEKLKRAVRQHGPAAKLINNLIHNYLGRNDLELVAREDGYQLRRAGKTVRGSLSEGEKTAIALCYFLSTLEAEGRKRKDLIIVIDDPVSSLDTRALNYAFSIVRSALGDAGQLFLLTHNLNFMNEAKKWLKPKTEKELAKRERSSPPTATLLFLEAVQNGDVAESRAATLRELPALLREYESEYHYLFDLVFEFSESPGENAPFFYLIPNALRKVLDIFSAFKFPGSEGLASKVEYISKLEHGLDAGRIRALERLAQVESHADNISDLVTFSSMTIEETKDAADTLLKLIECLDKDHYDRMKRICHR